MRKILILSIVIFNVIYFVGCSPQVNEMEEPSIPNSDKKSDENILDSKYDELFELTNKIIMQLDSGVLSEEIIVEMVEAGISPDVIDRVKENNQQGGTFNDGVYFGEGKAHNGDIKVEVTIKEGEIFFISVKEHQETAPALLEVFSEIPKAILNEQSTNGVDVVSGASEASQGYIDAVNDALEKAKN